MAIPLTSLGNFWHQRCMYIRSLSHLRQTVKWKQSTRDLEHPNSAPKVRVQFEITTWGNSNPSANPLLFLYAKIQPWRQGNLNGNKTNNLSGKWGVSQLWDLLFPSPSLGKAIITYSVAFRDTRYQQRPPHFSLFWSNPEEESPPLSLSRCTDLADSHPSSSKEVPQSKNGHLSFSSHLAPSQRREKI